MCVCVAWEEDCTHNPTPKTYENMQSRSQNRLSVDIGAGPFGSSDYGDAFVKKRLNPADDMIPCTPIPDEKAYPSFTQQFRNQRVLSAANIANFSGDNWHADILLFSHPAMCYLFHIWDDNGHYALGCQMNNQLSSVVPTNPEMLTPSEYYDTVNSFTKQCEKYRCVYTSLTGNHISSDMYNAGLVCAGQYVWEPRELSSSSISPDPPTQETDLLKYPVRAFPDRMKNYSQLCQLPTAYASDAKDGFYMPLKIFSNEYHNTNDLVCYTNVPDSPIEWSPTYENSNRQPGTVSLNPNSQPPTEIFFPSGGTGGHYFANFPNLQFSSYYMGQISLRNISSQAQYMLTFRSGYELVTVPGSLFMQYVQASPPYDPMAIIQYTQLVNYIQDAYPDVYNDWGLLKQKIQQAWQKIKPVVSIAGRAVLNHYVPGFGSAIFS